METIKRDRYLLRSACKSTAICNCRNFVEERKRRRGGTPTKATSVPEDLVMEILLRLPVKSLVRFNSVCKHWYDLIGSPNFITAHYEITSLKKKVSMLYCDVDHSYIDSTVSFQFFNVPVKLAVPPSSKPRLVGCYNGLVCLSLSRLRHDKFLLWNPATTQSRIISTPGPNIKTQLEYYYSGLCFDSVANTHKILRIIFYLKDNAKIGNMTVPKGMLYVFAYVYTLNDDSWRMKKLFAPCRFPNGGYMSGVTHLMRFMCWMVEADVGEDDKYILCLDMVDEEFKLIELPSADHIHCDTKLVDYKGSIAMFVWEYSGAHNACIDMWVLNDCGTTNQSWCKQLTLRPPMRNVHPRGFFTKGGVDFVILSLPGERLLWDEDSGETNNVILEKYRGGPSFVYIESLASVY